MVEKHAVLLISKFKKKSFGKLLLYNRNVTLFIFYYRNIVNFGIYSDFMFHYTIPTVFFFYYSAPEILAALFLSTGVH